jgi:hypothetical protein
VTAPHITEIMPAGGPEDLARLTQEDLVAAVRARLGVSC